jgi:hypothetical protein
MDDIEEVDFEEIPVAAIRPLHPILRAQKSPNAMLDEDNYATFRQTPQTVKRSVMMWGPSLQYVRPELITYELCELAISHHSGAIACVPRDRFSAEEYHALCLFAVSDNGFTLQEIPRDAITTEIVQAAHRHTCCAIMHTPREFLTEELCWRAIERNGDMLEYVPAEYVTDEMRRAAEECSARIKKENSERAAALTEQLMRDGELSCPVQ